MHFLSEAVDHFDVLSQPRRAGATSGGALDSWFGAVFDDDFCLGEGPEGGGFAFL